MKNPAQKIILWICIVITSVWSSEFISEYTILGIPEINVTPLAASSILTTNLLAMFAFIYLEYLLTTKSGGMESPSVITAGFLSLWIVRNILKAVFEDWTIGWWAAELLLLVGLVIGPVILGMLYLGSMFEAEESQSRATLYADLLGHDITNYLQAIQVALDILNLDEASSDVKVKALNDARLSLTRADHLIRNVRHLGRTQESQEKSIERTDLVACIYRALNQVILMSSPDEVEFNINKDQGECYVPANDLLTDIFLNLFRNAIKYSPEKKRIDVEIKSILREDGNYWEVQVIDYGIGIETERKELLFTRFMESANGIGLGLWVVKALTDSFAGEVEVIDRIKSDYTKGSVFVVRFPAYQE
jgi:signal transduction histidine kinase